MAAPTAPKGSQGSMQPGFEGFPFPTAGKPPEDGKQPEQSGEVRKKPCRACTDFKSWMKLHQKQSATHVEVNIKRFFLNIYGTSAIVVLLLTIQFYLKCCFI